MSVQNNTQFSSVQSIVSAGASSATSGVQADAKKVQSDLDTLTKNPTDTKAQASFATDLQQLAQEEKGGSLSADDLQSLQSAVSSSLTDAGVSSGTISSILSQFSASGNTQALAPAKMADPGSTEVRTPNS